MKRTTESVTIVFSIKHKLKSVICAMTLLSMVYEQKKCNSAQYSLKSSYCITKASKQIKKWTFLVKYSRRASSTWVMESASNLS